MSTEALLTERGKTHGQFSQNAIYGQELRLLFRSSPQWSTMPAVQREALDVVAVKISRILSGQAWFEDHWLDAIGYFKLALDVCDEERSRQVSQPRNET